MVAQRKVFRHSDDAIADVAKLADKYMALIPTMGVEAVEKWQQATETLLKMKQRNKEYDDAVNKEPAPDPEPDMDNTDIDLFSSFTMRTWLNALRKLKPDDDDASSTCSSVSNEVTEDIRDDISDISSVFSEAETNTTNEPRAEKWDKTTQVKDISGWKRSKKYAICHLVNSRSNTKETTVKWCYKPSKSVTDPIIGRVRIVKKLKTSVTIRYKTKRDGWLERSAMLTRNEGDGRGNFISVTYTNRIYLNQNDAGDGFI